MIKSHLGLVKYYEDQFSSTIDIGIKWISKGWQPEQWEVDMAIKRTVMTCVVLSSVSSKMFFFQNFKISEKSSVTDSSDAKQAHFDLH